MIIKFKIYESLKDKMKGKTDSEVNKAIDDIIYEIIDLLEKEDDVDDYYKSYDFIKDSYTDMIMDSIEEGHPSFMIAPFIVDMITNFV